MSIYNYTVPLSDEEKTKLNFSLESQRYFILNPVHADFETKNENGIITNLDYNGCYSIKENSNITINKNKYKIQKITRKSDGYYLYMHESITKSTTFIMPFLGGIRSYYRYNNEFVNCYIGTETDGEYGNRIYLLYRYSGDVAYAEFEAKIKNHPYFEDMYDPDKYHSMYIFSIPTDFVDDIYSIISGNYSKITNDSKERILKFNDAKQDGDLEQILYRDLKRKVKIEHDLGCELPKDAELYSKFGIIDEIYTAKYTII